MPGLPLTPRQLAQLLAGFGIKAKQIRQGPDTRKGYLRVDFTDAFRRYLPPDPKHPKHRPGLAAFASQGESRCSGAVSDREQPATPEHAGHVSGVSDAHDEDPGVKE